jgi:hypothetical protein
VQYPIDGADRFRFESDCYIIFGTGHSCVIRPNGDIELTGMWDKDRRSSPTIIKSKTGRSCNQRGG